MVGEYRQSIDVTSLRIAEYINVGQVIGEGQGSHIPILRQLKLDLQAGEPARRDTTD